MENFLQLETEHEATKTIIVVDNSTEFKDFRISVTSNDKSIKSIDLQLSQAVQGDWKGTPCLQIGKVSLIGREIQLLKEFLNQI